MYCKIIESNTVRVGNRIPEEAATLFSINFYFPIKRHITCYSFIRYGLLFDGNYEPF